MRERRRAVRIETLAIKLPPMSAAQARLVAAHVAVTAAPGLSESRNVLVKVSSTTPERVASAILLQLARGRR